MTFDYSAVTGDLWTDFSSGKVQISFEAPYGSDIYEERIKQADVDPDKKEVSLTFYAIPDIEVYCSAFYITDEEGHVRNLAISQPSPDTSEKDGYTVTKDPYKQSAILTFGDAGVSGGVKVKVLNAAAGAAS